MASVLVNVEKGVEVAAEDALKWITGAAKKEAAIEPAAQAALASLLGGVDKALGDVNTAAEAPLNVLNVTFDTATFQDLKAVWPQLKTFVATLGIKL